MTRTKQKKRRAKHCEQHIVFINGNRSQQNPKLNVGRWNQLSIRMSTDVRRSVRGGDDQHHIPHHSACQCFSCNLLNFTFSTNKWKMTSFLDWNCHSNGVHHFTLYGATFGRSIQNKNCYFFSIAELYFCR